MQKLTLKKVAENTLLKVGKPLTTKEIWEKANELGTVENFVSNGKTPDATIGAYIYWSLRDKEGIFTKVDGKPFISANTRYKILWFQWFAKRIARRQKFLSVDKFAVPHPQLFIPPTVTCNPLYEEPSFNS
jgi:hypothetical protein